MYPNRSYGYSRLPGAEHASPLSGLWSGLVIDCDYSTVPVMDEPAERDPDKDTPQQTSSPEDDFLSNILAPGSSLNPSFLLVVDGVLALLALTLLSLVIVTGGNVHLIALLFIELALWLSIKW